MGGTSEPIIVAIDGHSSCGKSTMARQLARQVGYLYVDTGAMYRAVTLYALRQGFINTNGEVVSIDEDGLRAHIEQGRVSVAFQPQTGHTLLCGEDVEDTIRTPEVSDRVSHIAALPFVRQFLVAEQQALGRAKGIVMDGRDIGTTVFPQAELKVFVTASAEIRAQRRFDELCANGVPAISYDAILQNVRQRDYIDEHRAVSPLRQAPDAVRLDNSLLTRQEQLQWLMQQFQRVANA